MPRTIAIAGCMERIGTTTQAIQATLALKNLTANTERNKVCYLEMHESDYLKNLLALYKSASDEDSYVKYGGINMYKSAFAKETAKQRYDFVIRDYGAVNAKNFEKSSFAEQPTKIIVCGSKPNEIFKVQDILYDPVYDDAFFVFSFVPDKEKASIVSLMMDRGTKTFFSGVILEPFELSSDSVKLYGRIMSR